MSFLFDASTDARDFLVATVDRLVDPSSSSAGDDPATAGSRCGRRDRVHAGDGPVAGPRSDRRRQPQLRATTGPRIRCTPSWRTRPRRGRRTDDLHERSPRRVPVRSPRRPTRRHAQLGRARRRRPPPAPMSSPTPMSTCRPRATAVASAFVNLVGARDRAEVLGLYANAGGERDAWRRSSATTCRRPHAVLLPERLPTVTRAASSRSPTSSTATVRPSPRAHLDEPSLSVDDRPRRRDDHRPSTIRGAVDLHQVSRPLAGVARLAPGEIDDPDRFLARRCRTPPGSRPTSSPTSATAPRRRGAAGTTP